jgi:hypothetical protein
MEFKNITVSLRILDMSFRTVLDDSMSDGSTTVLVTPEQFQNTRTSLCKGEEILFSGIGSPILLKKMFFYDSFVCNLS